MPKTRPYRDALLKALANPTEAAHYLNAAIADSPEMFKKACLNVIQARQVTKTARESGLTRESLYRSFSIEGNPTLDTLLSVFAVLKIKTFFAAEGAEVPAPPSIVPKARVKINRRGRKRAPRIVELREADQFELPFSTGGAGVGSETPFSVSGCTIALAVPTGYFYKSSSVSPNDHIQLNAFASHLAQESSGTSVFCIPFANTTVPQSSLLAF